MKAERSTSFREAVALNNIGTCLLERGVYGEAAEAFKGAITMMRSMVVGDEDSSAGIAEKLHTARRMMATAPLKKRATIGRAEVDVVPNDSMACLRVGVSTSLSERVSAIRIENYTSGSSDENTTAAILFYNYGIVCYLLAQTTKGHLKRTSHPKRTAQLKTAIRMFRISHSMCSKVVEQQDARSADRFQVLHIMGIVLMALSCCLLSSEAKPYSVKLAHVQKVLQETHNTLFMSDSPTASAAA